MSAIEKALLEATGEKPQKKSEDRQKYLLRLAVHANDKLTDEEWDALEKTAGATEWAVAAVKADNAKKAVPDFPDLEDEADDDEADAAEEESEDGEADEDEDAGEEDADDEPEEGEDEDAGEEDADDEPEEGEEEEVTTKAKANGKAKSGGKKAPAKNKPAPKTAAKTKDKPASKAAKSGAKKPTSMRRALKTMVVKQPKKTVDDLIEMLEKKGYEKVSKLTVTTIRADTRDTIKVLVEAGVTDLSKVDLGGRAGAD